MSARANARSSYFNRVVFDRRKFSKVEAGLRGRGISTRLVGLREARAAEGISFGGTLRASHGRRASGRTSEFRWFRGLVGRVNMA